MILIVILNIKLKVFEKIGKFSLKIFTENEGSLVKKLLKTYYNEQKNYIIMKFS